MKKIVLLIFILLNTVVNAQEDKTVTLTVSGTGKTLEEARLNALRSSIEQAFGAFISSKTEILNDNLVKDEIVSISNGNIQKYDVVSQLEVPNVGYAMTLIATVSIDKLTSFSENKGIAVEFKGNLFAANIKLQKLNENSEIKVMFDLFGIIHQNFQSSFNYLIETKNIILDNDKINYNVPLKITATTNENYDSTLNYLLKVLSNVSMNSTQVDEYNVMKKDVYKIKITYNNKDNTYYLRKKESFDLLKNFQNAWLFYLGCFDVKNGINIFHGPTGLRYRLEAGDTLWEQINYPFSVNTNNLSDYDEYFKNGKRKFISIRGEKSWAEKEDERYLTFNMPSISKSVADFEWNDIVSLNEIEKITNYTVNPSGIISKFKDGGYVIYEKNGKSIIACPFPINDYNDWGVYQSSKPLGNGSKLFDGKINTSKISQINCTNNIGKKIKNFSVAGYNDWSIPSSDELSLIFNKIYLMGFGTEYWGTFYSSTEVIPENYFLSQNFGKVYSVSFEWYFRKFIESYLTNKNLNPKDDLLINIKTSSKNDEYKEHLEYKWFQLVRYVDNVK